MRATAFAVALVAASVVVAERPAAQSRPFVEPAAAAIYERLLQAISKIRIFDHHAHPGWADDPEIDPAPVPGGHAPLVLTPTNTDWAAAAREMAPATLPPTHAGPAFFNAVLDRLGIETSMANRIEMAGYLDPARFKWVFYVDSFLFPFDNTALAARNGDQAVFMPEQTKMLRRFEQQAGLSSLPASLDEYLAFVTRSLEASKGRGGVAVKFELSYFRSLSVDDPPRDEADAIYAKYHAGGVPSAADYKTFQDFLFRYLVVESGRLGLPVHIHSSAGAGDYFMLAGVNVLNLEPVLRDPRYAATTFVLIHGGYPFDREAIFLAGMKNVYLDSSATDSFLLYPDAFKRVLKNWLETYPDKITFGSDAFPLDEKTGAERLYWIAVHTARTALAAALAEMIASREITQQTAMRFAHEYLHDTAAGLYAAPAKPSGADPNVRTTPR